MNTDFSKPNAVYLYVPDDDVIDCSNSATRLKRRVMLDNTWDDDYCSFVECNSMALCSGIAYRGRANRLNNPQQINALIIFYGQCLSILARMGMYHVKLPILPDPQIKKLMTHLQCIHLLLNYYTDIIFLAVNHYLQKTIVEC